MFSADPSETLLKSSETLDSNHLHFFHLLSMTMFRSCTRKSAKTGECHAHGGRAHTGRDQGQVQPRRLKAEYLGEISLTEGSSAGTIIPSSSKGEASTETRE